MTRQPLTPYRTIDEVADILAGYRPPRNTERKSKLASEAEYDRRIAKRKLIRAAFDVVRNDPTRAEERAIFLSALAGHAEITDELMDKAAALKNGDQPGE